MGVCACVSVRGMLVVLVYERACVRAYMCAHARMRVCLYDNIVIWHRRYSFDEMKRMTLLERDDGVKRYNRRVLIAFREL